VDAESDSNPGHQTIESGDTLRVPVVGDPEVRAGIAPDPELWVSGPNRQKIGQGRGKLSGCAPAGPRGHCQDVQTVASDLRRRRGNVGRTKQRN